MRPSPILGKGLRRLPLTTKQANKGYYKGNRTGSMGRHTKFGGYILDAAKMRTYVVPNLYDFQLSPFVDRNVKTTNETFMEYRQGPADGGVLLDAWKAQGGEEMPERTLEDLPEILLDDPADEPFYEGPKPSTMSSTESQDRVDPSTSRPPEGTREVRV